MGVQRIYPWSSSEGRSLLVGSRDLLDLALLVHRPPVDGSLCLSDTLQATTETALETDSNPSIVTLNQGAHLQALTQQATKSEMIIDTRGTQYQILIGSEPHDFRSRSMQTRRGRGPS